MILDVKFFLKPQGVLRNEYFIIYLKKSNISAYACTSLGNSGSILTKLIAQFLRRRARCLRTEWNGGFSLHAFCSF